MRTKGGVFLLFSVGMLLAPGWAAAQGPSIEHAAVGCIVAEQYPKLTACFSPAADLARARVYFRSEGGPYWYFVPFNPESPCFLATLPKPKKTIKKIEYYIEAVDNKYGESRTSDFAADVVLDRGACRKDVLAAPYAAKASVAVGSVAGAPAVPIGFAGVAGAGISGTTLGLGALGLGAAGGVVYGVTNGGGNGNGGNNQGPGGNPPGGPQPPTPPSDQPPPPPGPPSSNLPPNAVFEISPDPPEGVVPFNVRFSMCGSTDPDRDELRFSYDFGDGSRDSGGCSTRHTYNNSSLARRTIAAGSYTATICVTDGLPGHERCRSFGVKAGSPPCSEPTVRITTPANGAEIGSCSIPIAADASSDVKKVRFEAMSYSGTEVIGEDASAPFDVVWSVPSGLSDNVTLTATARNACGDTATDSIAISVFCYGGPMVGRTQKTRRVSWVADLDVPGSRGQLILNNGAASFPGSGRAFGLGEARKGENRIEGRLVEGRQVPGTWRFDFSTSPIFDPGSIRVTAGNVVSVSAYAVVFRLSGRPGEPIDFSFRVKD